MVGSQPFTARRRPVATAGAGTGFTVRTRDDRPGDYGQVMFVVPVQ